MSKAGDGEVDIDVDDVLETAQEDWDADTDGLSHLTEEAFTRCWFQLIDVSVLISYMRHAHTRRLPLLHIQPSRCRSQARAALTHADSTLRRVALLLCACARLHTDSLDAAEYAAWGDGTLHMITEVDPATGMRVWRADRELVRVAFSQVGGGRSAAAQREFDRSMQSSLRRWSSTFNAGVGADAVAAAARQVLANNQAKAASLLGISKSTLRTRLSLLRSEESKSDSE